MTIKPYKGRIVEPGAKVGIHRNLHQRNWSIVAEEGSLKGLVVGHADTIHVWRAEFKVNEAGRQRVIRERKKNVHAKVVGILGRGFEASMWDGFNFTHKVKYNPYKDSQFQMFTEPDSLNGEAIKSAGFALFTDTGLVWVVAPRLP